jgi:tetratricopeptide (TPR) repeat protein
VPQQLPTAPPTFVARDAELAWLTSTLIGRDGAVAVVSAVGGVSGVGKSWLVVQWAHQYIDAFPDGQLHVDLRGVDPVREPLPAADVLRGFLDALGVDSAAMPEDLEARIGLYRSLMAGRRMLVVLDNAAGSDQVVPLLPGSPTCKVAITSRRRLVGLATNHGAAIADLDVFRSDDARRLLVDRIGVERTAREPEAVDDLVRWCAGLPLALSIVAARANLSPDLPLAALARELADSRLDTLDGGELTANLRAVISWSTRGLPDDVHRLFHLLGVAPGDDIDLAAASSLAGVPPSATKGLLRQLEDVNLVRQHVPGRFRMHDLIRLYAAERGRAELSDAAKAAASLRMIDFVLYTAFSAARLLDPHRPPIDLEPAVEGCFPVTFSELGLAWTWFTAEYSKAKDVLRRAETLGYDSRTWRLAWTHENYYLRYGFFEDAMTSWRAGLAAARRLGDSSAEVLALRRLGYACARAGHHDEAVSHLEQALVAAAGSDPKAEAHTHRNLARAWSAKGDRHKALHHATVARDLYRSAQMPAWEADVLNMMGWYESQLGDHVSARAHCAQALDMVRHRGKADFIECAALHSLGAIAYQEGLYVEAVDRYRESIRLRRELGDAAYEASTLDDLGMAYFALDAHAEAAEAWRQALALYLAQYRVVEAERVRDQLAALDVVPD